MTRRKKKPPVGDRRLRRAPRRDGRRAGLVV